MSKLYAAFSEVSRSITEESEGSLRINMDKYPSIIKICADIEEFAKKIEAEKILINPVLEESNSVAFELFSSCLILKEENAKAFKEAIDEIDVLLFSTFDKSTVQTTLIIKNMWVDSNE